LLHGQLLTEVRLQDSAKMSTGQTKK